MDAATQHAAGKPIVEMARCYFLLALLRARGLAEVSEPPVVHIRARAAALADQRARAPGWTARAPEARTPPAHAIDATSSP